jgi:hypothetical protein
MEENSSNPMLVDDDDDCDDADSELHRYLQLRIAVIGLKEAILHYTQKMRDFNPASGCVDEDVQLILKKGGRMLYLADKVCDQADAVEECIDKDIRYARQAKDLAKQVLRHCHTGPFNPDQPSPEMVEDAGLKYLARKMGGAIAEYNEKLAEGSPDEMLHGKIRELDAQANLMVGIAIDKYDEIIHARKICEREKKDAREMMEYAKRALSDLHGEGI